MTRTVRGIRDSIPAGYVIGRLSGKGAPQLLKISELITKKQKGEPIDFSLDRIGNTWGDILFRGQNGWEALAAGTSGYFLQTAGAGADPAWALPEEGGPLGRALTAYFPGEAVNRHTFSGTLTLTGQGDSVAFPVEIREPLFLDSLTLRSTSTTLARSFEWRLFSNDGTNGTGSEIAGANGTASWTASAASNQNSAAATPGLVEPGVYWLVVRNTHASNSLQVGQSSSASITGFPFTGNDVAQTKTGVAALTTTIDLTTSWTKTNNFPGIVLLGRVLGASAPY